MRDVAFKLSGTQIPSAHGAALKREVEGWLPWLADLEPAGIHPIHVANSMNGWRRPDEGGESAIFLSRRTMLVLRLPTQNIGSCVALTGATLNLNGYPVTVGTHKVRDLRPLNTLFARQVLSEAGESERDFLSRVDAGFAQSLDRFGALVCGLESQVEIDGGTRCARSLMVTGLDSESSLQLQSVGFGPGRKFGCGLFIGHKGVGQLPPSEFE